MHTFTDIRIVHANMRKSQQYLQRARQKKRKTTGTFNWKAVDSSVLAYTQITCMVCIGRAHCNAQCIYISRLLTTKLKLRIPAKWINSNNSKYYLQITDASMSAIQYDISFFFRYGYCCLSDSELYTNTARDFYCFECLNSNYNGMRGTRVSMWIIEIFPYVSLELLNCKVNLKKSIILSGYILISNWFRLHIFIC